MFQFPSFALTMSVTGLQPAGLPHSEITGSIPVCSSPVLIAAYHVLHRLQKPRHPPFALVTFSLYDFSNHGPMFTHLSYLLVALKLQSTQLDDRLSIVNCYRLNLISNFTSLSFLKLVNELRALRCANRYMSKRPFYCTRTRALQSTAKLVS